jgi:hypothetical protein
MKIILRFLMCLAVWTSLSLQSNDSGAWDGKLPDCQIRNYNINLNNQLLSSSTILDIMGELGRNSLLVPTGYPLFLSGRPLIIVKLKVENPENMEWRELKQKIESMMTTLKNKAGIAVECSAFETL